MRFGEDWPAPQSGGGPAITPPAPRAVAGMDRYVGKWARLWLAGHPGCQSHPECAALSDTQSDPAAGGTR